MSAFYERYESSRFQGNFMSDPLCLVPNVRMQLQLKILQTLKMKLDRLSTTFVFTREERVASMLRGNVHIDTTCVWGL